MPHFVETVIVFKGFAEVFDADLLCLGGSIEGGVGDCIGGGCRSGGDFFDDENGG
jgi:hypothetical protein